MRCFLALFNVFGQIPNGVYESDKSSHRDNFYLVIENTKATLYAWEISLNKDTLYYCSTTTIDTTGYLDFKSYQLEFKFYDLSKKKYVKSNLRGFKPNKKLTGLTNRDEKQEVFTSMLYSTFVIFNVEKDKVELQAIKDTYLSRADKFTFELSN